MKVAVRAGFAIALACAMGIHASTQGAEPGPDPPTLWQLFGISQKVHKAKDGLVNRKGNHPKLERKPPLKALADAANLESDVPAIKKAAEVKAEEDQKGQKIKAVKYLAKVGCGCYEGVKEALLAALDDCTEEVRYEAAMAFCNASGDPCAACNPNSCCDADVIEKLSEVALGRDADGCYKEPSPRVRAAARLALSACEQVFVPTPAPEKKEVPIEGPPKETGDPFLPERGLQETPAEPAPTEPGKDATALIANPVSSPHLAEPHQLVSEASVSGEKGHVEPAQPSYRTAAFQPPSPPPVQPIQPVQPPVPAEPIPEQLAMVSYGDIWERALQAIEYDVGPAEATTQQEATSVAAPDLGGLLQESSSVRTVKVQRRSPVSLDPNIRGFKAGQVYTLADGVYWTPARRDLDSMLSKIDPGMIQDVVVIPGPYGLRYGPGFAFIDVMREPTPRYEQGFETHFRTSGTVRTNGGQFYGRETVYGGGPDRGFRFSYGHRRGSDYRSGGGLDIPSSYENRDLWGEFGYDINPDQRIEVAYQRLDQTDTEYAGQFFDIDFLGTYGFQLRLIDEDPYAPWTRFTVEGWYNRTRFTGDTAGKHNPDFPVLQRVEYALDQRLPNAAPHRVDGTTRGAVVSSGARAGMTFGEPEDAHVRLGADFRYLGQRIQEDLVVSPDLGDLRTNMPHAWLRDPGAYAELSLPWLQSWTVNLGARVDWVGTTARAGDLRDPTMLPGGPSALRQEDVLYAFYLMNEIDLNENWMLTAGLGHGQRPPTLIERYADGLFLGIIQSGFTRVVGRPGLAEERDWQIDVGLETGQEYWRGRAAFFHAWVLDYVTLMDNTVVQLDDARLLYFMNTELATLTGFELAGEFDLLPRLSTFGTMRYVDGRDREIHAPLPAIPPLEGLVGVRLHDAEGGRRWGVECAARIVNDQDRLGGIRLRSATVIGPLEERTPGFTVWHLRGYYNWTENLSLIAGIENLFDKNYQEHLDLRLLKPPVYAPTRVLSPGFTPYFSIEWIF